MNPNFNGDQMIKTKKQLTNAQTTIMSRELNALHQQATQQLEEHKQWLHWQIAGLPVDIVEGAEHTALLDQIAEVTHGTITREIDATITMVYEYPDGLFDFMTSARAPAVLRKCMEGGVLL